MTITDVDIEHCHVTWAKIGNGIWIFACFSPIVHYPIALVTATIAGKGTAGKMRAEILSSDVSDWARRQGVRTLINKAIFDKWDVDVIMTQNGTTDGAAFMEATGYRLDKKIGVWYLTKTMFKRNQNKKSEVKHG